MNYLIIILGIVIVGYAFVNLFYQFREPLGESNTPDELALHEKIKHLEDELNEVNGSFYDISNELIERIERVEKRVRQNHYTSELPKVESEPQSTIVQRTKYSKSIPSTTGQEVVIESENEAEKSTKQTVIEMYHSGESIAFIARQLGLGVGEVSLMIDMNKSEWNLS